MLNYQIKFIDSQLSLNQTQQLWIDWTTTKVRQYSCLITALWENDKLEIECLFKDPYIDFDNTSLVKKWKEDYSSFKKKRRGHYNTFVITDCSEIIQFKLTYA